MLYTVDMIAQHDACIVAWREKVRHDLVRPSTILKEVLKGKNVPAFVSNEQGVQPVPVEEYRPFLAEQPHSEFPSASAVICTASLEGIQLGFDTLNGRNNSLGPFGFPAPPGIFPFDINETVQVLFNTTQDAIKNCAMSRLWAGMHFRPSIEAGQQLGKGIGEQALKQMISLYRGKVPSGCDRCL